MRAKVRPDANWHVVTACGGVNFTQRDWTKVPPGREEEALNNPYLEVELGEKKEAEEPVEKAPTPQPPPALEPDIDFVVEKYVEEVDASYAARTLAAASGIHLWSIKGSGRDGKITVTDVRNAIKKEANDDY